MNRVKIGQKLVLKTRKDHNFQCEMDVMLCSVPDKNVGPDEVSVNLINIKNGNRWNDELHTVGVVEAYKTGLDFDFVKKTIVALEFMDIIEVYG